MPQPRSNVIDPDAVRHRLATELPRWGFEAGWIQRPVHTSGWKSTLMVVNTVGHVAEVAWHHPDLAVSYDCVVIRLRTHDAGGITAKDFALARKIDEVLGWRPQDDPGSPLEGTPDDPRWRHLLPDG